MAFIGIPSHEAMYVLKEEVDLGERKIRHNGVTYEIPNLAVAVFDVGVNADSFNCASQAYIKAVVRNRARSKYLMSGVYSSQINFKDMARICRMHIENKDLYITYERVYMSGYFYRFLESEKAGITPDFEKLAKIKLKYSRGKLDDKGVWFKVYCIKKKYEQWKHTFA